MQALCRRSRGARRGKGGVIVMNNDGPAPSAHVPLISDQSGRLLLLDVPPGDSEFAAARRAMRSWEPPAGAPADSTRYVNAGLHEVPRRLLPAAEELRQARDIRELLSANKIRAVENDFRLYSLTECAHPAEPGCIVDDGHDWSSDPRIDGGHTDGLKSAHCRRPECHITKQWADQCDRPDAYETDVPFVQYGKLGGTGLAAHEDAYGTNKAGKVDDSADSDGDVTAADDAGAPDGRGEKVKMDAGGVK